MLVGFDKNGVQVDLPGYSLDLTGTLPEHWRLIGQGQIMRVATSFLPVLEERPDAGPAEGAPMPQPIDEYQPAMPPPPPPIEPPPPRPPVPRGYAPREIVECEQPAPPPPPAAEPEPEPEPVLEPERVGEHLGSCTHLPPMAGVNDRIYHEIDNVEYLYTVNGWVRQDAPPEEVTQVEPVKAPRKRRSSK